MRHARKVRSTCEIGAEIVACYLHKPRTRSEVKAQVDLGSATEPNWFRQMRASGILCRIGFRKLPRGRPTAVYALQAPFAQADAPYCADSWLVG
jgi:hypothetical protein